jgi:hypothetical protein
MAHIDVIGMYVFCRNCSQRIQLGPLNAREVGSPGPGQPEPYAVGWLCRCDRCCKEFTYQRAEIVTQ